VREPKGPGFDQLGQAGQARDSADHKPTRSQEARGRPRHEERTDGCGGAERLQQPRQPDQAPRIVAQDGDQAQAQRRDRDRCEEKEKVDERQRSDQDREG
jgi:hypothetical protein